MGLPVSKPKSAVASFAPDMTLLDWQIKDFKQLLAIADDKKKETIATVHYTSFNKVYVSLKTLYGN